MKFAKNKTHRPAPGMRISRRPGSASKACPICNGPLRIGQIMLPSPEPDSPDRKFKMESCVSCHQVRLQGTQGWVKDGDGYEGRLHQEAMDSNLWRTMTGEGQPGKNSPQVDLYEADPRWSVSVVPYHGDPPTYGPGVSEPMLPREYSTGAMPQPVLPSCYDQAPTGLGRLGYIMNRLMGG